MTEPSVSELFAELPVERDRLAWSRACRDGMIQRLHAVDPASSADAITQEYIEVTVAEALEDLQTPGAGDFFGRITEQAHASPSDTSSDTWYIGRRHIEDVDHNPVVVDWRAPIAAPFYRATGADPLGLAHRRRFTLDDGELIAYLDEALDDPDAAAVAGGIPDPVLAEIGAARTGAMREIVATIQGEQDVVIRSSIDGCLVVQGGPGTGKTAVGLHRAAYLLFEHRRRLARDGVLVVGPNPVFLEYVANVLPSLGERSVRQTTVVDLCVPKVEITAVDDVDSARWKGHADRLVELDAMLRGAVRPPASELRCAAGARSLVISVDDIAEFLDTALNGSQPINKRRESLKNIVNQSLLRRLDRDDMWADLPELRAALAKAWPVQRPRDVVDRFLPGQRGRRRRWTVADQILVDEANSQLNGTPFVYGHVVIDEAQDLSAVALRAVGRRSPRQSMTVLGDLAQSSTPAGQRDWRSAFGHLGADEFRVVELTIGYRVPAAILDVANRLLPLTGVAATASSSVRNVGRVPHVITVTSANLGNEVVEHALRLRHRHRNVGIIAPHTLHAAIIDACTTRDIDAVQHVRAADAHQLPLFDPEQVKGLEFDAVVVAQPHDVLSEGERGARLLYVALTRAVQVLDIVTDAPLPDVLGDIPVWPPADPAVA